MAATAPQVNYANYPLKDIAAPHPHDVLCGRGGGTNNHIGNSHWRMLVAANKQLYITLPKRQKMLLSRSIVNAVRSQNPPGRFLQKDSKSNKWFDVGDQRAQEKTSQALREGAPDIRKKVSSKDADKTEEDVESTEGNTENPGAASEKSEKTASNNVKKEEAKPATTPTVPTTDAPVASSSDKPSRNAPQATPKQPQAPAQQQPPAAPQAAQQQQQQQQHPGHPQQGMMPQGFNMGHHPGMGQHPNMGQIFPAQMNGGMGGYHPQQQAMGNQQQMMYFNGQNMVPMQLYPTMVLNEHGVMVPAMSVMPPPNMQQQQQQQHAHQMMSSAQQQQHNMQNHGNQQQLYDDLEPIPHRPGNNGRQQQQQQRNSSSGQQKRMPDFDDLMGAGVAPPPDAGLASISFGSMGMTDAEMRRLQHMRTSQTSGAVQGADGEPVPLALDGLEPTGISFGDVSMMSVGTKKLEENGCSFGTMMSYQTNRTEADMMKLEQIGTSFGSLSLDTTNRDTLFHQLELAAAGPEVPPMFDTEKKATGNLLECSDTESETEEEKHQLKAQKSQQWEKMQNSVLHSQKSKGTIGSSELMPPPVDMKGSVLNVPTTNFERDFSQLSAYDFGDNSHRDDDDDVAAPPPTQQLKKQGSDEEEKLELFYLQQYEKQKG